MVPVIGCNLHPASLQTARVSSTRLTVRAVCRLYHLRRSRSDTHKFYLPLCWLYLHYACVFFTTDSCSGRCWPMTLLSSRRRRHHDDVVVAAVAAVVAAAVNVYGLPMPVLITSMSVVTPAGSGHVWPCMYNRRSPCSVMNLHSSGQRSASTYETIIVYCSRILASAARAILPSTVRNLGLSVAFLLSTIAR